MRARVLAARPGRSSAPVVGEVAVQVDAPSVLAGAGLDAVRVDGLHDPQLDPSQVAVAVLEDVHDLLALGLVAVDRADNERLARGVRIAQSHRVQLGPPHRVAKRHSPPEDPEAALGRRRVGDTARGERAHPERVPSAASRRVRCGDEQGRQPPRPSVHWKWTEPDGESNLNLGRRWSVFGPGESVIRVVGSGAAGRPAPVAAGAWGQASVTSVRPRIARASAAREGRKLLECPSGSGRAAGNPRIASTTSLRMRARLAGGRQRSLFEKCSANRLDRLRRTMGSAPDQLIRGVRIAP